METSPLTVTQIPPDAQIITLKERNAPTQGRGRLVLFSAENLDLKSEEEKHEIVEALCARTADQNSKPPTIGEGKRLSEVINCPLCPDLKFEEPRKFYGHLRKHAGIEDKFRCGFCDREFESLAKRASHERVHEEFEATFKCDICSLGFLR